MKLLIHFQTSRVQPWNLIMDKLFHLVLFGGWNYLSMLGWRLIRVSKKGPWCRCVWSGVCSINLHATYIPEWLNTISYYELIGHFTIKGFKRREHLIYPQNTLSFVSTLLCSSSFRRHTNGCAKSTDSHMINEKYQTHNIFFIIHWKRRKRIVMSSKAPITYTVLYIYKLAEIKRLGQ